LLYNYFHKGEAKGDTIDRDEGPYNLIAGPKRATLRSPLSLLLF